jgi:hypothetical protein
LLKENVELQKKANLSPDHPNQAFTEPGGNQKSDHKE